MTINRWNANLFVTLNVLHFFQLKFGLSEKPKICVLLRNFNTTTYKSSLTQKKLYKKTNAIFSIYGKKRDYPMTFLLNSHLGLLRSLRLNENRPLNCNLSWEQPLIWWNWASTPLSRCRYRLGKVWVGLD